MAPSITRSLFALACAVASLSPSSFGPTSLIFSSRGGGGGGLMFGEARAVGGVGQHPGARSLPGQHPANFVPEPLDNSPEAREFYDSEKARLEKQSAWRWWHLTKIPDEENPFRTNGRTGINSFPWKLMLFFMLVGTCVAYGGGGLAGNGRRTRKRN